MDIKLSTVVIASIGWTLLLTASVVAAVFAVNTRIDYLSYKFDQKIDTLDNQFNAVNSKLDMFDTKFNQRFEVEDNQFDAVSAKLDIFDTDFTSDWADLQRQIEDLLDSIKVLILV